MAEVRAAIDVHRSPSAVFTALTDPARLSRWLGERVQFESRAGGRVASTDAGVTTTGHVLEVVPARRLLIAWDPAQPASADAPPAFPPGSRLELTLAPEDGSTRLAAIHWYLPAEAAAAAQRDLDLRLGRLRALLEPAA
ncbi:SRPBCC domain-containing protein [Leifsonia sp. NPDC058194]|uniref:SRPBCC family protein n=1 Tax=Leifsonia sp. NPDC058194 TaxID=3346374 RepID=UPI0036DBCFAD